MKFYLPSPDKNSDVGCLNIDPVSILIGKAGLRVFVDAVEDIEARLWEGRDPEYWVAPSPRIRRGGGWEAIFYTRERDRYSFAYKSVCWETPAAQVVEIAAELRSYLRKLDGAGLDQKAVLPLGAPWSW